MEYNQAPISARKNRQGGRPEKQLERLTTYIWIE